MAPILIAGFLRRDPLLFPATDLQQDEEGKSLEEFVSRSGSKALARGGRVFFQDFFDEDGNVRKDVLSSRHTHALSFKEVSFLKHLLDNEKENKERNLDKACLLAGVERDWALRLFRKPAVRSFTRCLEISSRVVEKLDPSYVAEKYVLMAEGLWKPDEVERHGIDQIAERTWPKSERMQVQVSKGPDYDMDQLYALELENRKLREIVANCTIPTQGQA